MQPLWTVGILEPGLCPVRRALRRMLAQTAAPGQAVTFLPGRRALRPHPDGAYYRADALVAVPGFRTDRGFESRIAVLPGTDAAAWRVRAGEVITYGLSARDTLTLSSVTDDRLALAVQREIVDVAGRRVDRQEITLRRPPRLELWQCLACAGTLLAAGVDPARLPPLFARRGGIAAQTAAYT
ncbi:MAG: hypothetical protein LBH86_09815 [Oscillospiraceae bacterium]|jgi:hypothetical protein|nr:hypothetical protein [Oscillospiraceae bacterium]